MEIDIMNDNDSKENISQKNIKLSKISPIQDINLTIKSEKDNNDNLKQINSNKGEYNDSIKDIQNDNENTSKFVSIEKKIYFFKYLNLNKKNIKNLNFIL